MVVTEALILGLLFPPVLVVIVVLAAAGAGAGADDGNGALKEFLEDFFRELRLSKRGVRLQFG